MFQSIINFILTPVVSGNVELAIIDGGVSLMLALAALSAGVAAKGQHDSRKSVRRQSEDAGELQLKRERADAESAQAKFLEEEKASKEKSILTSGLKQNLLNQRARSFGVDTSASRPSSEFAGATPQNNSSRIFR